MIFRTNGQSDRGASVRVLLSRIRNVVYNAQLLFIRIGGKRKLSAKSDRSNTIGCRQAR